MRKEFAVVGASIAGSVCALVLQRLGYQVTIFEKSSDTQIPDRGAGIWLPNRVIQDLIEKEFLPENFPHLIISQRPIHLRDEHGQQRTLTSHPLQASPVHWLDLFEALKERRPEDNVRYNSEVTGVDTNANGVSLTVNNTEQHQFDFCVFADGGQSLGRKKLFPGAKPSFTNTVVWRGTLVDFDKEMAKSHFEEKGSFYVCSKGHLLIYLVPNRNARIPTEDYMINWLFYEHVTEAHPFFISGADSNNHNVVKGKMSEEYRQYLLKLVGMHLPPVPCKVIESTSQPFLQAMYEMLIPSYIVGDRICLIGDASTVLRAHTASGATKAIEDALALGEHLSVPKRQPQAALKVWNENQYASGQALFHLGQRLGEMFVTNPPNWKEATSEEIDRMWLIATEGDCWYAGELEDEKQKLLDLYETSCCH